MRRDLEIVVAADETWGIGLHGAQTLVIPEDRRCFREITEHGSVIVGRRTLSDFPGGKPLKNRRNIVLTRDPSFSVDGADIAHSVAEALSLCSADKKVYVIGGASVYQALFPYCARAHVTRIFVKTENDVFFPNLEALPDWRLADAAETRQSHGLLYSFQTWERL